MSATWTSRLPEFERKLGTDEKAIVRGVTDLAYDSIVGGDLSAGSPGQPEDLRQGQWEKEISDTEGTIGTNDPSARSVEDGISHKYGGPITLNSPIGGFHSVKLTHQNADNLIRKVVKDVGGKG